MRDDDDVTVGVLLIESPRHCGHSVRHLDEALTGEGEVLRVLQVGLEVAREDAGDVPPRMTLPSTDHGPLGQAGIDLHRHTGARRDRFPSAQGAFQWGGPDGHDRPGAEITSHPFGLLDAVWGEAESWEVGVDQMGRIVDFGVTNQMYQGSHAAHCGRNLARPEVTPQLTSTGMWAEPILHVDLDAFFVEAERLRDPGLIGRPVAVGGTGGRGVIASASYEARSYGVRSAQPTSIALRLCKELIVVPPAHSRYGELSAQVFAIFREFTPVVEGLSVDEAFLDVSGLRRHYSGPLEVATALREAIRGRVGLPASVGVAASKFMAKLASEAAKPDGQLHVPKETELAFLHALPVEALWGVGPATLAGLQRIGVVTIGDLAELPEAALVRSLGPTQGRHLLDLAHGIDPRPVTPDSGAKSISVEETYDRDLEGAEVMTTALLAQAQRLSDRLHRAGLAARTVTLKVRFSDFSTITRSVTAGGAVDSPRALFAAANGLLGQVALERPVRLLGLGGSGLEPADEPRQLPIESDEGWSRIAEAVAGVRDRFGEHSVEPARLLNAPDRKQGRTR